MNKIWNIGTWVAGFIMLLIMAAFSSKKQDEVQVQGIDIQIDYSQKQYFVTEADVEQIVRGEYPYLDSLFYREINITVLEETLDNHPSIRKAEVYSALDGILRIHVRQKQPCYRVHNSVRDYYIDETGDSMALSPHFSAKVPLVTGSLSAETEQKIFEFFSMANQDGFFADFFTGIHVDEEGAWELYPKPGRHKVLLGQPEKIEEKMKKLKVFYMNVIDQKNIDSIASLNLAYDKQVICTKY